TLNLYDTSDSNANYGATSVTTISDLGMGAGSIVYGTLETLNVSLGSGGDTFDVVSTLAGVTTTLNTNAGADTVNVQTNATALTVDRKGGEERKNVVWSAEARRVDAGGEG